MYVLQWDKQGGNRVPRWRIIWFLWFHQKPIKKGCVSHPYIQVSGFHMSQARSLSCAVDRLRAQLQHTCSVQHKALLVQTTLYH